MIKIALASMAFTSLVVGSTTMCFKKDHLDPSSIENTPLDGGECKGEFSVNQMKSQGYNIKDIKITLGDNGMNYLYILSKETVVVGGKNTTNGQALSKEQLRAYLYEMQEEDAIKQKKKERLGNIQAGKALYEKQCTQCHGEKGEKRAYNASRPLKDMSLEDMEYAIRDYTIDERKGPMAMLMKPYAAGLNEEKLKNIHSYLQSIK